MNSPERQKITIKMIVGQEAPELNEIRVINGRQTAAAISRGGAVKRYGNSTSNEDGVLLAEGPCRSLLAVADAHGGPQASEMALNWLADYRVTTWVAKGTSIDKWLVEAMDLFICVNDYIYRESQRASGSRTTLAVALIDPVQELVYAASAGDSHVFLLDPKGASALAVGPGAGAFFLGMGPQSRADIGEACGASAVSIDTAEAIVLASDGLSTKGIGFTDPLGVVRKTVSAIPPSDSTTKWAKALAVELVTRTCRTQVDNQSGDDISVAVVRINNKKQHRGSWQCPRMDI